MPLLSLLKSTLGCCGRGRYQPLALLLVSAGSDLAVAGRLTVAFVDAVFAWLVGGGVGWVRWDPDLDEGLAEGFEEGFDGAPATVLVGLICAAAAVFLVVCADRATTSVRRICCPGKIVKGARI